MKKTVKGFPVRCLLATAVSLASINLAGVQTAMAQDSGQITAPATTAGQRTENFSIAAQPLASAILKFADQAGIDLYSQGLDLSARQSTGLHGRYSIQAGIEQLLAGTGIGFRYQPQVGNGRLAIQLFEQQSSDNGNIILAPITIEGQQGQSSARDWVFQEARSVSVVTSADIDRRPPRHAADMLADVAGVASAVDRNSPSLSVNIRGMQDFGRVNMMIDGMRQNHVESGHQQRNGEMYVDSELLSSVVIEKGPNAGIHGANAIAGSANFRTLDYDDIILSGQDHGVRLRATTGVGGDANGVRFLGSAAVAARFDERLELLAARSQKNLGAYAIGDRGRTWYTQSSSLGQEQISEMLFSAQKQDSWLTKARLKLTDAQALQFTYTGTESSYSNTSDWSQGNPNGNRSLGSAKAENNSFALDYVFSPDNRLIDLKAKLYYVTTENERVNGAVSGVLVDYPWDQGHCLQDPIAATHLASCLQGLDKTTTSRTDTWGIQLENTSRFVLKALPNAEWALNYGFEWFQDEGKSSNKADRNGQITDYLARQTSSNLNPNGRRDVASAFSSLTFNNDPFMLSAGLRYDWYHIRGKTMLPAAESRYLSRFDAFADYFCKRNQANVTNATGCGLAVAGDEAAAAAWYDNLAGGANGYHITSRFAPKWLDEAVKKEYEVDRRQGEVSPFVAAAYKPLDWLELFTNWGKGYRPPAMTETLWEGSHPGGGSASMFPNPLLESERSTSWEVGLNIFRQHLFLQDDRFGLKLAYFDTKVDNFIYTGLTNALPGVITHSDRNTFFVNNLENTRFRGLELDAQYDAGFAYVAVNATRYIGGENDFCKKLRPLGSQLTAFDQPREDGSMSPEHLRALAAGYASYQQMLDAQNICGIAGIMNATRAIPMDRHGGTLGVRLLERKLDMGIRYNRSKGAAPSNWSSGINLWDSYTVWDFYAKYQPLETLAVSLAVENLRDENYLGGYSDMMSRTYAPGRTVQAGLEFRF